MPVFSKNPFSRILGFHQLCQVYAFHFFELLGKVREVHTSKSLAG